MQKENAWPIQVLSLSMKSRIFCMCASLDWCRIPEDYFPISPQPACKKNTIRGRRMVSSLPVTRCSSGLLLLRRRLLGREVMVVRHARADLGVEEPAHRARGELLLRLLDLAEDRVVLPLVGGLVVDDELAGQYRVRRLVEPDALLLL